jgi:hypothetical protein
VDLEVSLVAMTHLTGQFNRRVTMPQLHVRFSSDASMAPLANLTVLISAEN